MLLMVSHDALLLIVHDQLDSICTTTLPPTCVGFHCHINRSNVAPLKGTTPPA